MIIPLFARLHHMLMRTRTRRVTTVGLSALVAILVVSTLGFWFLETEKDLSLFDAFWMSYVTMSTVGYGDLYPTTGWGRLFGMVVTMTGGIGILAYMISQVVTTFIETENKKLKGLAQVKWEGHFLIFNCPNEEKVLTIIDEIRLDRHTNEVPIVLISNDFEECPDAFLDIEKFRFVRGNPLSKRVLQRANAARATRAIILARDTRDPNSDGISTQIALTLEAIHRELQSNIHTVAEAVSRDAVSPLKTAGVEDVICLETIIPPALVQAFLNPGVVDFNAILSSNREGSQYYVGKISHLEGCSYGEIRRLFQRMDDMRIVPIAVSRNDKPVVNPEGSLTIEQGDRLLYIAQERKELEKRLRYSGDKLEWKTG